MIDSMIEKLKSTPELAEALKLSFVALRDLEDLFQKIKSSKAITKLSSNSEAMSSFYFTVLAMFCVNQLMEVSGKAKMIHNETQTELHPSDRFEVMINEYLSRLELFVNLSNSTMKAQRNAQQ